MQRLVHSSQGLVQILNDITINRLCVIQDMYMKKVGHSKVAAQH